MVSLLCSGAAAVHMVSATAVNIFPGVGCPRPRACSAQYGTNSSGTVRMMPASMAAKGRRLRVDVETFDGDRKVLEPSWEADTVGDLRGLCAKAFGWPLAETRMVCRGLELDADEVPLADVNGMHHGENPLLRAWHSPPLPKGANEGRVRSSELRAALGELATALGAVRPRTYVAILAWLVSAKLAGLAGFGNPYVLLSMLVLVLSNLGQRRAGELSAYNVFNPQWQELLGQLRLEHLERDLIDPHRLAGR